MASKTASKVASKVAFYGLLLSLLLFGGCAVDEAITRALPTPLNEIINQLGNPSNAPSDLADPASLFFTNASGNGAIPHVDTSTLLDRITVTYKPFALRHADKFSLGDFDSPYLIEIAGLDFATNGTIVLSGEDHPLVKTNYGGGAYLGITGFSFSNYVRLYNANTHKQISLRLRFRSADGTYRVDMDLTRVSVSAPTLIYTWQDLQGMKHDLAGEYELRDDVTFPDKGREGLEEAGFEPVGNILTGFGFTGSFAGGGHRIVNLSIERHGMDYVAIWSYVNNTNSVIENFVVDHGGIGGNNQVGAVVGALQNGTVSNVGMVSSRKRSVSGTGNEVGGLVGYNDSGTVAGYATGRVSGNNDVGGLVGWNNGGTAAGYATGAVSGNDEVGGLVGENKGSANGYATGVVSGNDKIGGLVGENTGTATGYATGRVSGVTNVGGLVGYNDGGAVTGYATGAVSGTRLVGGLVGQNAGSGAVNGYWNIGSTGEATSSGGVGISAITDVVYDGTADTYMDGSTQVFNDVTFLMHFDLPGRGGAWPTLRAVP